MRFIVCSFNFPQGGLGRRPADRRPHATGSQIVTRRAPWSNGPKTLKSGARASRVHTDTRPSIHDVTPAPFLHPRPRILRGTGFPDRFSGYRPARTTRVFPPLGR